MAISARKQAICARNVLHVREHINCEVDEAIIVTKRAQGSRYKGRMVNALASGADEGRDKLR